MADDLIRNPFEQDNRLNIDFNYMPSMQEAPRSNALWAGLKAGNDEFWGTVLGSGGAALGTLTGSDGLKDWGTRYKASADAASARDGRPDLEGMPWREGGPSLSQLPAWGVYQLAKQGTNIGASILGGIGAAAVAPAVGLGAFGARLAGAGAVQYPQAVGSMFGQAMEREEAGGDKAGFGDAAKAAIMGVPYAAAEGLMPALLPGTFKHAAKEVVAGNFKEGAKAATKAIGLGFLEEAPTEAVQTAMEMSFRPDLSMADKAQNVVDAFLVGGIVGGGASGIAHGAGRVARKFSGADPSQISTDDTKGAIDEALGLPAPGGTNPGFVDPNAGPDQKSAMPVNPEGVSGENLYQHDLNAQATEDADKITPPWVGKQFERLEDGDVAKMLAVAEANGAQVSQPVLAALRAETSRRAHASMDDDALEAQIAGTHGTIQKMQAEGMDLPAGITSQLTTLTAEKNRRAGMEPTSLFGEQELAKAQEKKTPEPQEEESAARAARVNQDEMRNTMLELLGTDAEGKQVRPNQFLAKLSVQNDEELGHAILDRLAATKNKDAKALAIGQKLGLVDEAGNPVDHAAKLDEVRGELAAARIARLQMFPNDDMRTPVLAAQDAAKGVGVELDGVTQIEKQIAGLQRAQALAQSVQQRRAGGTAAGPQAQSEASTPASTGPAPATQMTLQAARPTGFVDTRNYLRDAAGGSPAAHSAARQMAPQNLPEAVQGVLAHLGEKPANRWGKIYKTWGEHFGLVEGGKLLSLPQAIQSTQAQIVRAQNLGDGGTLGMLTQRLDALSAAQTAQMEKAATGPSAATEQTAGAINEESAARTAQLRERMHQIEADSEVPIGLRQRAKEVRGLINQRAASATEKANELMADYSARTGKHMGSMAANDAALGAAADRKQAGEKIHQADGVGLVRSVTTLGDNIYTATKAMPNGDTWEGRKSIDHGSFDDPTQHPFTKAEVEHLRYLAKVHNDEDLHRKDENPEGPFARIEQGMNAVASESVDPRLTETLSDWLQMFGLDNVRVFIADQTDLNNATEARTKYGLNGGFSNVFQYHGRDPYGATNSTGGRPGDYYIYLKSGMGEKLAVETLGHEMGHIIEREVIDRLPAREKLAIRAAFDKWYAEKKGLPTAREYIRAMRADAMGEAAAGNYSETTSASAIRDGYWNSFKEWWADQVAKYATTQTKPVGIVEKFFATLGQKLREFAALVTGSRVGNKDRLPTDQIKDFLDRMAETRDADAFIKALGGSGVRTSNTETVRGPGSMAQGPEGLGPRAVNRNLKDTMAQADGVLAKLKASWDNISLTYLPKALGLFDVNHMAVQMEKRGFSLVRLFEQAQEYRKALGIRYTQLLHNSIMTFSQASKADKENLNALMRATEFNLAPWKTWAQTIKEQPELANRPEMKAKLAEFNKLWNEGFSRGEQRKMQQLYMDLHAGNNAVNYGRMAMLNFYAVSSHPDVSAALNFSDPSNTFLADEKLHEQPQAIANYWKDALTAQQTTLENYLNEQMAALTDAKGKNAEAISKRIDALQKIWARNNETMAAMEKAPNFHLGRVGEYYIAFDMRTIGGTGENKDDVNPVALRQVAEKFQQMGLSVQMSKDNTSKDVYIRVEKPSDAQRVENVLKGDLNKFVSNIQQGKRTDQGFYERVSPEWLLTMEKSIISHYGAEISRLQAEENGAEKNKDRIANQRDMRDHSISILRDTYLDSLPDSSIAKVLVHRNAVPGYNPDMFRNNGFRMQVGINSLANLAATPRVQDALTQMKKQVELDKSDRSLSVKQRTQRQMVLEELQLRESQRAMNMGSDWIDAVRAINHNFYLGLNPAYAALNVMQLGITTLPELAKNGGFVKAMKVMGANSKVALRVVNETWKAGMAMGWSHIGDGTVTRDILKKAGLNERQMFVVTQLVNMGGIDLGGQTRQLGQIVENPSSLTTGKEKAEHAFAGGMRVAASFGLYTEMFSRLVAGLSAAQLSPNGRDPILHARQVIKDTLYDYEGSNAPRALGKHGIMGPATPAVLAFHNYSAFTMMKLGREFYDLSGVNKQLPEAERKRLQSEAKTFLAGHFAALTVFTGTLGLPAASIIIRAVEGIKDLFDDDDQPWDLKASYRTWLASVFGKDVGEMISHGFASRLAGVEVTARAGEQDLIPFTKLLTDKRKFEDAIKDFGSRGWGAPASMVASMLSGMGQVAHGDVMKGMTQMLPVAVANAMKAGDLMQNGYTDKFGQKLPNLNAGAQDILKQALGFMPANKAEYNEEAFSYRQRKGSIGAEATDLRQKIAVAIERGNMDEARDYMARAAKFDQNNPAFAVLPRLAATIQSRATARTMAEAQHLPLGVNQKDIAGKGQLGFANY